MRDIKIPNAASGLPPHLAIMLGRTYRDEFEEVIVRNADALKPFVADMSFPASIHAVAIIFLTPSVFLTKVHSGVGEVEKMITKEQLYDQSVVSQMNACMIVLAVMK